MSPREIVAVILLLTGVAVELACCVGLLRVKDSFDRLHFLGPASTAGPVLIAAYALLRYGFHPAGIKAGVIAAALVAFGPILTHATARAARIREFGEWHILESERQP